MVLELCKLHEIPVHVLWHDHVVESFTPACHNDVSRQALHIRGDHAYFYKDAHTKGWIARQAQVVPAARATETMKIAPRRPRPTGRNGRGCKWTATFWGALGTSIS